LQFSVLALENGKGIRNIDKAGDFAQTLSINLDYFTTGTGKIASTALFQKTALAFDKRGELCLWDFLFCHCVESRQLPVEPLVAATGNWPVITANVFLGLGRCLHAVEAWLGARTEYEAAKGEQSKSRKRADHCVYLIVGITKLEPSRTPPLGQRAVTVLILV